MEDQEIDHLTKIATLSEKVGLGWDAEARHLLNCTILFA